MSLNTINYVIDDYLIPFRTPSRTKTGWANAHPTY